MQVGLQAHDAEDRRGVEARNGRRGHGGREFSFGRGDARELSLEHAGDIDDRGVDEDVQAHRIRHRVHDEALAAQPRRNPVVIALQRKIGGLELGPADCRPMTHPGVEIHGISHLQAHRQAHWRRQLTRGQSGANHPRATRLAQGWDLPDRIRQRYAGSRVPNSTRSLRKKKGGHQKRRSTDRSQTSHRRIRSSSKSVIDPKLIPSHLHLSRSALLGCRNVREVT